MEIIVGIFTIIGGIVGWSLALLKIKYERKDKFRMAAIEKRLDAHQKAYAMCAKIIDVTSSHERKEVVEVMNESRLFLANYSLYLEQGTRNKFVDVIGFLNAFCPMDDFINKRKIEDQDRAFDRYLKEIDKISELGYLIQKEVELEPIVLKLDTPIKKEDQNYE